MNLVADASVALKWIFHDAPGETDVMDSSNVLERAMEMSARFKHHLFDTMYHAVALEHGGTFVTADDSYFAKAFRLGNIKLLTNFV